MGGGGTCHLHLSTLAYAVPLPRKLFQPYNGPDVWESSGLVWLLLCGACGLRGNLAGVHLTPSVLSLLMCQASCSWPDPLRSEPPAPPSHSLGRCHLFFHGRSVSSCFCLLGLGVLFYAEAGRELEPVKPDTPVCRHRLCRMCSDLPRGLRGCPRLPVRTWAPRSTLAGRPCPSSHT